MYLFIGSSFLFMRITLSGQYSRNVHCWSFWQKKLLSIVATLSESNNVTIDIHIINRNILLFYLLPQPIVIGTVVNKFIFYSYRQPSLSVTNDELISGDVRPGLGISIGLLDGIVISSSAGNLFVTQKVHVLYDSFFMLFFLFLFLR